MIISSSYCQHSLGTLICRLSFTCILCVGIRFAVAASPMRWQVLDKNRMDYFFFLQNSCSVLYKCIGWSINCPDHHYLVYQLPNIIHTFIMVPYLSSNITPLLPYLMPIIHLPLYLHYYTSFIHLTLHLCIMGKWH